ncbi:serine hydroxymethyltransferase, partial [Gluconacetobacter azotocaptans]|nr:serine hydroxymethyltransferase [Gluconacetobacter azotocaptans]
MDELENITMPDQMSQSGLHAFFRSTLAERDPDVAAMIGGELERQ